MKGSSACWTNGHFPRLFLGEACELRMKITEDQLKRWLDRVSGRSALAGFSFSICFVAKQIQPRKCDTEGHSFDLEVLFVRGTVVNAS